MISKINSTAIVVLCLFVAGCSTDSLVSHSIGGGRYLVQRTMSDPHAFANTIQTYWLEACTGKEKETANGYSVMEFFDCHTQGSFNTSISTGYVSGLVAPAIQAGGMIGAGALIGNGLRHSGSNTTNNNSGGTQSQLQGQGQAQGQTQSLSIRGGH